MSADDERRDRYLFDPAAKPDPDVQAFEERLAAARFDPRRRPLALPPLRPRPVVRFRATAAVAAAAVLIVALGVAAYWSWRWSWTNGAAWAAQIDDSADGRAVAATLAIDKPLVLTRT